MNIDLTVSAGDEEIDLRITCATPTPIGPLRPALLGALGVAADSALRSGARTVGDGELIGAVGLQDGARLTAGEVTPQRAAHDDAGLLALAVVGGPCSGRQITLRHGSGVEVGRAADCDLRLDDDRVSRHHARVEVGERVLLRSPGEHSRTTLLGQPPVRDDPVRLGTADRVRMGDSLLRLVRPDQPPATVSTTDGTLVVTPAGRPPAQPVPVGRDIPVPTSPRRHRQPWWRWATALAPVAVAGVLAFSLHAPQFLLFGLLSPLAMFSGAGSAGTGGPRRGRRRRAQEAVRRYDDAVASALRLEADARCAASPDSARVQWAARARARPLWERRAVDADLLHVSLGTGDVASLTHRVDDGRREPAGVLHSVPHVVDLRDGPLGLSGPRPVVAGVARWAISQLAVLVPPRELRFALLMGTDDADWRWLRWLPHFAGEVAVGAEEVEALATRLAAQRGPAAGNPALPWLVVVAVGIGAASDGPAMSALLALGVAGKVTGIYLERDEKLIPRCATSARSSGDTGSQLAVRGPAGDRAEIVGDRVDEAWAEAVARALAPLRLAERSGGDAPSRGLLSVLGLPAVDRLRATDVRRRWRLGTSTASTSLGMTGDGPLHIDLGRDGPHALIAGTTGSGKSELLRTLVTGLALQHPPDDIEFLLIDYKGGAAFAACRELPHVVGLVTDLDERLTARALRSLDVEIRHRETLLAEAGAVDLAAYHRVPGAAGLPRLVIVVDEFATLATALPDFLRGLVGVAQRGRSLGIHLVLATQRPGSAVSPEIRANTSLRLALRVTDAAESTDVVGTPDAAHLDPARPGSAVIRRGALLTSFRAASTGGDHEADTAEPMVRRGDPWRRDDPAQDADDARRLDRIVSTVAAAAERAGPGVAVAGARGPLWLAPLPDVLLPDQLPAVDGRSVPLGLVDLPEQRRQLPLTVDLEHPRPLCLVGSRGTGRTTALVRLARGAAARYPAAELEIYVLDANGELSTALHGLPHVATATGDADLAARLLERLAERCRTAGDVAAAGDRTRRLLLVDDWDRLVTAWDEAVAAASTVRLATVLRDGSQAALTVAVAGGRALLSPRLTSGVDTRLLLRMSEPGDYAAAGLSSRDVPATMPPGRGLRAHDAAEFQLAFGPDDPLGSGDATTAAGPDLGGPAPADLLPSAAIRLRALPRRVTAAQLTANGEADSIAVGLAGDSAEVLTWRPFTGSGRMLVAGPPRSGRSSLLMNLLTALLARRVPVLVAGPARSPLGEYARGCGLDVVEPGTGETGGRCVVSGIDRPTVLLVDDSEDFADGAAGDQLLALLRRDPRELTAIVAGRSEDVAVAFRGLACEVRRSRCGILLRPGRLDGELLGVRLPASTATPPPGGGVAVGDLAWSTDAGRGEPVPVQLCEPPTDRPGRRHDMCGYR